MRRSTLTAIVLAGLPGVVMAQTAPASTAPGSTLPVETPPAVFSVSVPRIRKALEKPGLELADRRPNFSITITDRLPFDYPFGRPEQTRQPGDWEAFFTSEAGAATAAAIGLTAATASLAGAGTMSAKPLIVMDALAAAAIVADKIGKALHNRKARKVRAQVRRELEEFCAANGCEVPE